MEDTFPTMTLLHIGTCKESVSMPHIIHAEEGCSGAEDIPDKLKEVYKENTSKYALTHEGCG
jgi:hypothetical protein